MDAVHARFPSLAQCLVALLGLVVTFAAGAQTPVYRQPGSAYTTRAMSGGAAPRTVVNERVSVAAPSQRPRSAHAETQPARQTGATSAKAARPTEAETPSTYVVRPGDTLSEIAVRHGLTTETLRAANGLAGDVVRIGQTLSLKPGRLSVPNGADAYVVQPNETFTDIAARYGVHPDDLARANPTVYPERLLVGETLKIPSAKARAGSQRVAPAAEAAPAADVAPAAETGKAVAAVALRSHVVAPGESLGTIAKRHGLATAALAAANGLKNPNLIVPGQRLLVPVAAPVEAAPPSPPSLPPAAAVPDLPAMVAAEPPAAVPAVVAPEPALPPGEAASPAAEPAVAQNPLASPELVELPEPARVAAPRGIMAYILEPGDTLESLARRFGTSVERLRAMNKLAADRQLGPDDEIIVPAAGAISLN